MTPPTPETAWAALRQALHPRPPELVARRAALGRVLERPVAARVDVPSVDVSAMDGYAVGAGAQVATPLPVGGTVAAGDPPGARLASPAAALRIMTGAPLPAGADRVVPIEQTELTDRGRDRVTLEAVLQAGANVRRRAEVVRSGEPLLGGGAELGAEALSLLAGHGIAEVWVHGAPRVAVLSTGDEVVAPEDDPRPGQLRDSHTDFLLAAGRRLGLDFVSLGIAPDEPVALERKLAAGLELDALIVCGGVSAGEFDLVEGVLARFGVRILFDRVAMQPGQPLVVGVQEPSGRLIFGLPGNPASAIVCFHLFVRPALRVLMGHDDALWRGVLNGRLDGPLPGAKERDRFLPARLALREGVAWVTPIEAKGSHDLVAYGRAAALVRVRARAAPRAAGEPCEACALF